MNSSPRRLSCFRYFFAVAISASADPALAQGAWTKQAPVPTGGDLYAVSQLSATDIRATGGSGIVAHTLDGGRSWSVKQLATNSLHALFFLDPQRGWAAGNGIFHTTDGGNTWLQDSQWGSIYDLYFLDAQRGWACGNGGVTYYTRNGGITWSFQPVGTQTTLSSIWFVDGARGWTVDIDGRIYQSTNGGRSWSLQFHAQDYLSTLQFFDSQEGWAIGGDTFLHTTNGGQSWLPASVPPGTWSHGARFSDRLNGLSVGEYGNITRTTDGGQSWVPQPVNFPTSVLFAVEALSPDVAWIAGANGFVARTLDGGASWEPETLPGGGSPALEALRFLDPERGWAGGEGIWGRELP